ncbi:alpha-glucan family phosphorylase, partial [Patescibacteria group bacterium]|nr:alpha-glucan family phosphorylase [Patescibacteria group bacterium]
VHIPTWDMISAVNIEKDKLWFLHQQRKETLLKFIEEKTGQRWNQSDFLVGWARRFVEYKRPLAILKDLKRFIALAKNKERPVRLVYAGLPHASDEVGQALLKELQQLIDGPLAGLVVYLPDFSIEEAKLLVSGCDVWLNTPVVGFEACGTSGMKAALNGCLPFSTQDGWVHEAEMFGVGWLIDDVKISEDILDKLEHDILPMYYNRFKEGISEEWERHMRNSRDMAINQFSATCMVKKYIKMLYT